MFDIQSHNQKQATSNQQLELISYTENEYLNVGHALHKTGRCYPIPTVKAIPVLEKGTFLIMVGDLGKRFYY